MLSAGINGSISLRLGFVSVNYREGRVWLWVIGVCKVGGGLGKGGHSLVTAGTSSVVLAHTDGVWSNSGSWSTHFNGLGVSWIWMEVAVVWLGSVSQVVCRPFNGACASLLCPLLVAEDLISSTARGPRCVHICTVRWTGHVYRCSRSCDYVCPRVVHWGKCRGLRSPAFWADMIHLFRVVAAITCLRLTFLWCECSIPSDDDVWGNVLL